MKKFLVLIIAISLFLSTYTVSFAQENRDETLLSNSYVYSEDNQIKDVELKGIIKNYNVQLKKINLKIECDLDNYLFIPTHWETNSDTAFILGNFVCKNEQYTGEIAVKDNGNYISGYIDKDSDFICFIIAKEKEELLKVKRNMYNSTINSIEREQENISEENNTRVKGTKRSTFNSNSVAAVEATGPSTLGTSSNASNLYVRSWLETDWSFNTSYSVRSVNTYFKPKQYSSGNMVHAVSVYPLNGATGNMSLNFSLPSPISAGISISWNNSSTNSYAAGAGIAANSYVKNFKFGGWSASKYFYKSRKTNNGIGSQFGIQLGGNCNSGAKYYYTVSTSILVYNAAGSYVSNSVDVDNYVQCS